MSDPSPVSTGLTVGVLGPLEVARDGVVLRLGGGRQRAVLALLVCEAGTTVTVDRLLDGVWGDHVPPGAVATLQTYVFHLRRVLEPDRSRGAVASVLVTVPGGYRLDVDRGSVDLVRFQDLVARGDTASEHGEPQRAVAAYTAALSLWRGEVLADLGAYDFVTRYRARLDELRASAQQSRVQAELDLGHHAAAVSELSVILSENPLREGLHAQRILALYRSGRQSDALAAYRELRALLDSELGIEPSGPLQELNTQVLRQDPLLDWTPPSTYWPRVSLPRTNSYVVEGQRRRLPSLAIVTAAVALLAGGAGLPAIVAPTASAAVLENSVIELDGSGRVVDSIPVGTNPVAVASTPGAIWVVNESDDTVSRVDTTTHAVQVIDVGDEPRAIAVTGEDLWVTNFQDGTVSRLNVKVTREVDRIEVGSGPDAIASGPAGLWVANSGDDTIQRIDQKTGATDDGPFDVGDGPDGLVVDESSVWVANGRGETVWQVNAQTGDLISKSDVDSGPRGMVRLDDDVWVANELSETVARIGISSGSSHTIKVGDGPTALAVFDGHVWVADQYGADLMRIDPDGERAERFDLDAAMHGMTVADGHLWVVVGAIPSRQHRGGTLRVAAADLPGKFVLPGGSLDPAIIFDLTSHVATRMVYDGLLAYHYGSADPQLLVPDLARSVPRPSDDGLTYLFNLRPGIRYSTGVEVQARDFVLGMRRALTHGAAQESYASLVGARACIHQPPRMCDLSRGMVADDAAGTVTFHLRKPDPEFLYKLSLLVVPAPPGTRLGHVITPPIPGTGPYQFASYVPGEALTLTRNPYYEKWSAAAQPDGFPDDIAWVKVADNRAAVDAVLHGDADLAELTPLGPGEDSSGDLVRELAVSKPGNVQHGRSQGTGFVVLNSSKLPFSRLRARQALNYAVNRTRVVNLMGGPDVASPTCQLIPPTMPSYEPYCPFSTGTRDGDMAKAKALVSRSGTRGMRVTVTDIVRDYNPPLAGYIVHVLRKIGYRADLDELLDNDRNEKRYYSPRSGFQVTTGGWFADYPLPSNFYQLISCHPPDDGYQFVHCDEKLDRRAARATAQLQTNPAEALRAWTRIGRDLTDQAPLVAVTNDIHWWLTADRVGNYQTGGEGLGPLLSQLWVK